MSLVGLLLLSPFMMGHGCNESNESICEEAGPTEAVFEVTGSCGPSGRITVSSQLGTCAMTVTGDDVGLPMEGNRSYAIDIDDLTKGGWRLEGTGNGQGMLCEFSESGGGLESRCRGGELDCTAHLQAQ
ncbi:hypothetical protein BE08_40105 [Sorangium cellulosum]|uniref:Uncharacterized protein n=1 Tax=Sorangium cellulosum TaxID=56 RepID=A0A150PH00_SORCE|nr:hypothetical protein BE08_40105 [Sorangium cellulosum]